MGFPEKTKPPSKPRHRAPTTITPTPSTQSAPPPISPNSHSRSFSNALQNVRHLPRKALVCIPDRSDGKVNHRERGKKDNGRVGHGERGRAGTEAIQRASVVERSHSGSSSGTGSTSGGYSGSTSSSSRVLSPSASSASSVLIGPATTGHTKARKQTQHPDCLAKPIIPFPELVEALDRDMRISPSGRQRDTSQGENSHSVRIPAPIAVPSAYMNQSEDPIPRPLSPPNDHFRRQRVLSGSGPRLGPYTTPSPVNSPPGSPAPNEERVFLHDVLSCESLVAQRPKLYNAAAGHDDEEGEEDCRSIMSDIGVNVRNPAFPHQASVPAAVRGGAPATTFQRGVSSRWRSRARAPVSQMQTYNANENDSQALRRVFSR